MHKLIGFFFLISCAFSNELEIDRIFNDFEKVSNIKTKEKDNLPIFLNYNLQSGYFITPSAKMFNAGMLSLGFSYLSPYSIISGFLQYYDWLSFSGNYWIFNDQEEKNFGYKGFGNDADRVANVKILCLPSIKGLPSLAIGINDFIGSKRFNSKYIVSTYEMLKSNVEMSVGYGIGRMRGFFGAVAWSPFRKGNKLIKDLSFIGEYDPNNYKEHLYEHPKGKKTKSPINVGIHYSFKDLIDLSVSTLRGKKIASSLLMKYNLGKTSGLIPKVDDPPYYSNVFSKNINRTIDEFSYSLAMIFKNQGFDVRKIQEDNLSNVLTIRVVNLCYRKESELRKRIEYILSSVSFPKIEKFIVAVESDDLVTQQYNYRKRDLLRFNEKKIALAELHALSPMKEYSFNNNDFKSVYDNSSFIWTWNIFPTWITYFGSVKGKLKYDLGLLFGFNGYLWNWFYYDFNMDYVIYSTSQDVGDHDQPNPSKLLQVRTDMAKYYQKHSFHINKAYIQKNTNFTNGIYSRISIGYFELAYAGITYEALFFPVKSIFAMGIETSVLLKRKYSSMGFQRKIKKFNGVYTEKVHYVGLQYFLDLYFKVNPLKMDLKISAGQFLAKDKGIKFEAVRNFESGMTISLWYTLTNAVDMVNNHRYFDKGIGFSMPLDLFQKKSTKTVFGYNMSEWLRDVGQRAKTGKTLYSIISSDRNY